MSYNNGFPVGYSYYQQPTMVQQSPIIQQPTMQMQQTQMQPPPSSDNGIIWVQGEAGARGYLVAPGKSVMLMDSDASVFYIKTTDPSGIPYKLRVFDYQERLEQSDNVVAEIPAIDNQHVEKLEKEVAELNSKIKDLETQILDIVTAPSKGGQK